MNFINVIWKGGGGGGGVGGGGEEKEGLVGLND